MYSILICDDEKDIVNALSIYIKPEGYRIFKAYDGKEALKILRENSIQLVLLDVMMPKLDGISVLSELRKEWNVPVILLTAKSEQEDKLLGLNMGADDYITKPFSPMEVVARVRSQLRRYTSFGGLKSSEGRIVIGSVYLDDEQKSVLVDGEKVSLTPLEYNILS